MPRKTLSLSPEKFDWYLQDWMRSLGVTQAELGRKTGWPKATVSDIYHGKTHYYRDILNQAAKALELKPYELLLPVHEANEIRSFQQAVRLVAERKTSTDGDITSIERKEATA